MTMPRVSVITLVYRNAPLLLEALPQLEAQRFTDFEQILFDNGSPPDAELLSENWVRRHSWSRLVRSSTNLGICAGLNAAISEARGDYLAFFTDDLWSADHLASLVEAIESAGPNAVAAFSPAREVVADSGVNRLIPTSDALRSRGAHSLAARFDGDGVRLIPARAMAEVLLTANVVPAVSILVRRSVFDALGGYDAQLPFEDYDLSLRLALRGDWAFTSNVTATYVQRGVSFSQRFPAVVARGAAQTVAKSLGPLRKLGLGQASAEAVRRYASAAIDTALASRETKEATAALKLVPQIWPDLSLRSRVSLLRRVPRYATRRILEGRQ